MEKSSKDLFEVKMAKLFLCLAIFLSFLTGGCLTRTANPSLPCSASVNSANVSNSNSEVAVSRIQDMEAELRKIRDSLERLETSGGERSIKNLQERLSQIERQLGIENQKNQASNETEVNQKVASVSPMDSMNKGSDNNATR
ncbi:MAG: hypothetical protein ACP5VS_14850, partial [Desulfomonilaceae bacterium]